MCPVCEERCAVEQLNDGLRLCGTTGFAYYQHLGQIVLVETNRTVPPVVIVPISQRVTFNAARMKPAS